MIQISSQSIVKGRMLNTNDTSLFISEIDQLLKKLDFKGIIELTKNYQFDFIDSQELKIFIERAEEEHTNWYENPLEIKINAIEAFQTKCIACFFGKSIKAYHAEYIQMKDDKLPGRIIYSKSIAIYFEIKNNELFDFGWCNAFLGKNEMAAL